MTNVTVHGFPTIAPPDVPSRPAASRFDLIGESSFVPSGASDAAVLMLLRTV